MYKLIALTLWLVVPVSYAAPLSVAFSTPGIQVSDTEKQAVLQRLERLVGADLVMQDNKSTNGADFLLTSAKLTDNWHFTRVAVGYIPPLLAVSQQAIKQLTRLQIAQLKRPYTLQAADVHLIPTDSDVQALLKAKRFDAIIDIASNIVQHDVNSQLFRRQIYPGASLRLAVKDVAKINAIEQRAAIENTNNIKLIDSSIPEVKLHLIAKVFDSKKYVMQESAEDLALHSLLQQWSPQFSLNAVISSVADTELALQSADAVCVINYRKKDRTAQLVYSKPTQLYLGPRLYVLQSSTLRQSIATLIDNAKNVPLADIITLNKGVRLATLEALKNAIPQREQSSQSHHFLPLTRFGNAIALLQRQRVDAVWIYPVMFRFSLTQPLDAQNFMSFRLAESGRPTAVYLACNQQPQAISLVQHLDNLLTHASFQNALIAQNVVGLTETDTQDYIHQFRQLLEEYAVDARSDSVKSTPPTH